MATSTLNADSEILASLAERSQNEALWIRVGRLFDGVREKWVENANLAFDAEKILFVGDESQLPPNTLFSSEKVGPDAVLPQQTVLPCLIEAHAHLFLDGAPIVFAQREKYLQQPSDWMLERARARWPKILACGIGTVRDAGDKLGVGLALAREAKANLGKRANTPWIDSPGAAIHHRGRYGSFMGEPLEEYDTLADCVAGRVAAGADRIKLLVSGIINFKAGRVTTPPQMSAEEVSQLVAAAQQHGKQTFAHASGTEGVENSIAGGVTTIEHGFFVTPEQLARMRDLRIGWVPTFAPVALQCERGRELGWDDTVIDHLQRIIDGHREMLSLGHRLGVRIIAGSDAGSCGVAHGLGLLEELVHMEHAGMPPLAVLRSATGTSSEVLEFAEPVGRIAPDHRSRFIFTRHDLQESVAHLQRDRVILFDGNAMPAETVSLEGL
jgi:imidazolonepropionase-like amidohydrolase